MTKKRFRPDMPEHFRGYEEQLRNLTKKDLINIFGKPKNVQQWIVLPDVHRPFHNKVLWGKVMQLISDIGDSLYGVVLSGDYADLYTLGSYNENSLKNLTGITLESEYLDCNEGLDDLDYAIKNKDCKKYFLYGNHEDRYFREIAKGDKAKYGGALISPTEALKLRDRGYKVKENWKDDYFTLGEHLDVMHGMYCNIHAAKKHLDMTGNSCIFGHTHRVQSYNSGNRAAYNIGGLYDINHRVFNYMPRLQRNVWANGLARVYIDDDGKFFVEQVNVWNDKFFTNGKLY